MATSSRCASRSADSRRDPSTRPAEAIPGSSSASDRLSEDARASSYANRARVLPLTVPLVDAARREHEDSVRRSPQEPSPRLSEIAGVPVALKLENLQLTGSLKIRGAFFKLLRLPGADRERGVVTCSAGNHGMAVAYVARELGLRATIWVPRSVDESKYRGMVALGAD